MTTVHNHQRPYIAAHEANRNTPAAVGNQQPPVQSRVSGEAGSVPNRPPVGTEQRGRFSAHNGLVNTDSSGAPATGDAAKLAQLQRQNIELRQEFQELSKQMMPIVEQLQTEARELAEKHKAPEAQDNRDVSAPQPETVDSAPADPQVEAASTSEQTQEPVSEIHSALEQLTASTSELSKSIQDFIVLLNAAFVEIRSILAKLKEQNSAMKTPQQQPTAPAESPADTSPADSASSTATATPTTTTTIENLEKQNQLFSEQIKALKEKLPEELKKIQAEIQAHKPGTDAQAA